MWNITCTTWRGEITYPGLDHMGLVGADSPLIPQLVEWTLARWDGEPATPTC